MELMMKRITIRLDSARSGYCVSEPGWDGGDVYVASDVDARIADLELAAKENARYSTEMREEFERRGADYEHEKIMRQQCEARIDGLELALRKIKDTCGSLDPLGGTRAADIASRVLMER